MGVEATSGRIATVPPPERGDRKLARRRRLVPYVLLAPGGIYLFLLFLVPLAMMRSKAVGRVPG